MDLLNHRLVLIGAASPLKPMGTETPDQLAEKHILQGILEIDPLQEMLINLPPTRIESLQWAEIDLKTILQQETSHHLEILRHPETSRDMAQLVRMLFLFLLPG